MGSRQKQKQQESKECHYKSFQMGSFKVKRGSGEFGCPFCKSEERVVVGYEYTNLLQHAVIVGECSISPVESSKHWAMARYLALDLASDLSKLSHSSGDDDDDDEECQAPSSSRRRKRSDRSTTTKNKSKTISGTPPPSKQSSDQLALVEKEEKESLERTVEEMNTQMNALITEKESLERTIEEMNAQMNALITKERSSNDELQGVRGELIKGLSDFEGGIEIGIKNIGELDPDFFIGKLEGTFLRREAVIKGVELCSLWQNNIKDPHWHPFQIVDDDEGGARRSIKEDDTALQALKEEWGQEIHDAVVEALFDVHEHSSSGARELWNFRDKKKAALKDVVRHVFHLVAVKAEPSSRKRNDLINNSEGGLCGE